MVLAKQPHVERFACRRGLLYAIPSSGGEPQNDGNCQYPYAIIASTSQSTNNYAKT